MWKLVQKELDHRIDRREGDDQDGRGEEEKRQLAMSHDAQAPGSSRRPEATAALPTLAAR